MDCRRLLTACYVVRTWLDIWVGRRRKPLRALHTVQWAMKNDIHIRSQVRLPSLLPPPLKTLTTPVPRSHLSDIHSLWRAGSLDVSVLLAAAVQPHHPPASTQFVSERGAKNG